MVSSNIYVNDANYEPYPTPKPNPTAKPNPIPCHKANYADKV